LLQVDPIRFKPLEGRNDSHCDDTNSNTSYKIIPAVDEERQTKFTDKIPVSNHQQRNDSNDKGILIRMRHKLQKLYTKDDDYNNPFIAEIKKQVNEIHESNNKMIEEILAKERDEMARTLEERDTKHKADIEEINSQNKEEIQNLNAKHQNEIRIMPIEYDRSLATELSNESASESRRPSLFRFFTGKLFT
jgi:hypothetical protein